MYQDPSVGSIEAVNILALTLGILFGLLSFALPRRYALLPIILAACFVPVGGKITVAGLNFSILRLVCVFGWARIMAHNDLRHFQWVALDSIVVAWSIFRVVAFVLLWQSSQALTNALGYAFDGIGLYFLFRAFIQSADDLQNIFKVFAIALFPLALLMYVEKITGRDPFSVLGGVPEFVVIRNGVIRCQGSLAHPILAGTFGAVWLPLFVGLWWYGKGNRLLAILGVISCTLITALSGSSGPLFSYAAGIVGLLMWSIRRHMRLVRWGIVGCLLNLHAVMKDPVWFIFARVDVISGSTGWHRANLIDAAIRNFSDWCLVGAKDVARWGVWAGDTTNQYIVEGVRGGIITLLLFVWIIVAAFSTLGISMRTIKPELRQAERLLWAVGCGLLSHVISFWTIAYYDQNVVNWYLVLAMAAVAPVIARAAESPSTTPTVEPLSSEEAWQSTLQLCRGFQAYPSPIALREVR